MTTLCVCRKGLVVKAVMSHEDVRSRLGKNRKNNRPFAPLTQDAKDAKETFSAAGLTAEDKLASASRLV